MREGSIPTPVKVRAAQALVAIPGMITEFNAELGRITGMVDPDWSEAEKVLFFHDYLAEVCEYDLSYVKSDAYAALLGGTAVCQGYALAMNLLCRAVESEDGCRPILF